MNEIQTLPQFELVKYFPLAKVDDATHTAYGLVTAEVPDKDGEIADYDWCKEYYAKWSQEAAASTTAAGQDPSYGNIRWMHGLEIGGKVTQPPEYHDVAKEIYIHTQPTAAKWDDVKGGFVRGFSHGGRYGFRKCNDCGTPIASGRLCPNCGKQVYVRYGPILAEVSYVDSPCLGNATFRYVNAAGTEELRKFAVPVIEKGAKGIQFVIGFPKDGGGSEVQSVLFDSSVWDKKDAVAWLKDHAFTGTEVDETENTLRYRQADPDKYTRFRTITPGENADKTVTTATGYNYYDQRGANDPPPRTHRGQFTPRAAGPVNTMLTGYGYSHTRTGQVTPSGAGEAVRTLTYAHKEGPRVTVQENGAWTWDNGHGDQVTGTGLDRLNDQLKQYHAQKATAITTVDEAKAWAAQYGYDVVATGETYNGLRITLAPQGKDVETMNTEELKTLIRTEVTAAIATLKAPAPVKAAEPAADQTRLRKETVDVECPYCGHEFRCDEDEVTIECPECGEQVEIADNEKAAKAQKAFSASIAAFGTGKPLRKESVECPACGEEVGVPDDAEVGDEVECPSCGATCTVADTDPITLECDDEDKAARTEFAKALMALNPELAKGSNVAHLAAAAGLTLALLSEAAPTPAGAKAVRYLVTEDDGTTHLPVTGDDGKPDHGLMGNAWAALHGGFRGNQYSGPNKQAAIDKLKRLYEAEGMDTPNEKAYDTAEVAAVRRRLLHAVFRADSAPALLKGMGHVANCASLVEQLNWLRQAVEMEAGIENDDRDTAIALDLQGVITDLIDILKDLTEEEADEILEQFSSAAKALGALAAA